MARVRFFNGDQDSSPQEVEGRAGDSLLFLAGRNGVELEHACGGVCACSTCHVIVKKGFDDLNEITDAEADRLDTARGVTLKSRLGCQACLSREDAEIEVVIPKWNVNLVKETPH